MRAADFEQLSSKIIGILIDLRQLTNIEYKQHLKENSENSKLNFI